MRTQATRLDVLEAQQKAQQERFELIVLMPMGIVAVAVIGYAFGMFFAA